MRSPLYAKNMQDNRNKQVTVEDNDNQSNIFSHSSNFLKEITYESDNQQILPTVQVNTIVRNIAIYYSVENIFCVTKVFKITIILINK